MRRTHQSGRIGLVAALEQEEIAKVEAAIAEAPIGDNASSLETDLIEVSEIAAGADGDAVETEEAVDVVTALESIAEALGQSAKNGGMDRYAAEALGLAVDHMYKRVGLKRQAMPALESFGQTSSRMRATQIALEDIKEQVAKIWAAIVAAISKAIEVGHQREVLRKRAPG